MVKTKYDFQGNDGVGYAEMKKPEGIVGKTAGKKALGRGKKK